MLRRVFSACQIKTESESIVEFCCGTITRIGADIRVMVGLFNGEKKQQINTLMSAIGVICIRCEDKDMDIRMDLH